MPRPMLMKNAARLHAAASRARSIKPFGRRRMRDRHDDEVGAAAAARRARRADAARRHPRGASLRRASIADHPHAEGLAQARRLAADAAHADDQRRRLGQMHDAGVERLGLLFAAHLLRQVVVQAAREGQHEGHDVRADVIVEDLAEVGDHHGVRDQLGIVVPGRRRRLRRLQPAQAARRASTSGGITPKAASASAMSRIASSMVSGCSTRTPIGSAATRAAQARRVSSCGGSITSVKAAFSWALVPRSSCRGLCPASIDPQARAG